MEHPRDHAAEAPRGWDRRAVSVPVLLCLSLVGGQLPSFSTGANLWTVGTGALLLCLGLSRRVPRRPGPRRLPPGALWWLLPITVFLGFEAVTFAFERGQDFPTFSRLADPLLEARLFRSAAWFAWLAGFWALVRR
ncbi:hypothetical protein MRQ36_20550 [Micromonospora sp. R77]|uniref:hypothetical protein n=1 Tax=Micromonospora sp. R77 TaxID=2925836 RepID=UPI001F60E990|nr:hypothetical protein [Micromonospora sp. R77]MCI4064825.1 hypothetical protein [Micromonospora sp. R77]